MLTPQKILYDSIKKNFNKKALWFQDKFYTYEQIFNISKKILFKLNYHNSKIIAVLDEKNIFCYCSILSIFLSSKIYVPLNEKFSDEKNISIIKSANIDTILVGKKFLKKIKNFKKSFKKKIKIIVIDEKVLTEKEVKEIKFEKCRLSNISYIFFTSGSTGSPKGVPITNKNLINYLNNIKKRFLFNDNDRFSSNFDITFDLFLHDFFLSLTSGAILFIPDKYYFFNPSKFIQKHKITCWFSVPSLGLNMLNTKQLKNKNLKSLRYTAFCGEALPETLVNKWLIAAPKTIIDNLYGPTEATLAITGYRWNKNKSHNECENGIVPIGKIFKGNSFLKKKGKKFELILKGNQVFKGYLNNKKINKEKFLKIKGTSFFKTGDLIQINKSKNLIFMGRLDRQIKVRGFRIEPQEIENIIKKTLGVSEVVVIGWPPITNSKFSFENIIAFIRTNKILSEIKILKKISKKLSFNQIPKKVITLKKFHYNINKKVDYNYLINFLKK